MQTLERRNIDDLAMEMTVWVMVIWFDIETTAQGSGSGEEAALCSKRHSWQQTNEGVGEELNSSRYASLEIKSMDRRMNLIVKALSFDMDLVLTACGVCVVCVCVVVVCVWFSVWPIFVSIK